MTNPNVELRKKGQSLWYDNLHRDLIVSGDLKQMIDEDGVLGVVLNPAIFARAISVQDSYRHGLRVLAQNGKTAGEIFETLMVEDVSAACELFFPIYDRSNFVDGLITVPISPHLAHDTDATVAEARRLFAEVGWPNLMIEVPATTEGIPAIQQLITDGINVNATWLFWAEDYRKVAEAYIAGLNNRLKVGQFVDDVSSVASFPVNRVDAKVNPHLNYLIERCESPEDKELVAKLLGKAGVANCRMSHAVFQEVFDGDEFRRVADKGARVQRLLWCETQNDNPRHRETHYVQALIGGDTVASVSSDTLQAFKKDGIVVRTLDAFPGAGAIIATELSHLEIKMYELAPELLEEAISDQVESFDRLIEDMTERIEVFQGSSSNTSPD